CKKLIPTKDGYNLVAILPDSLTSPQLTAEWETRLTGIAKGSDSPADFMRGIEEMTAGLVKTYSAISEDKAKLFTPQREAIGTCPRCGAAVYEGKKNFYCSDRACSFVMWKNDRFFEQRKKAFTKAIAAALLKDGKVKIKGMILSRLVDTFFSRISLTMQPPPKPHSTACVLPWEEGRHWQSRSSGCSSSCESISR